MALNHLTNELEEMIKAVVLNKTPADVGFTANFNWAAGIIAEYILSGFNIHYIVKGSTLILNRLN